MPSYTLYTYSASPATHPRLPVLDPAGLYVASLLRTLDTLDFEVQPPNVWLHKTLPRLEINSVAENGRTSSSALVAEGVQGIERFVAGQQRPATSEDEVTKARLVALKAHLAAHLEPLVYSVVLFPALPSSSASASGSTASFASAAKAIFDKVTFPAYANGLSFPSSRTIPHRLREQCQGSLASSRSTAALHKALTSPSYEPAMSAEERQAREQKQRQKEQMRSLSNLGGASGSSRILRFGRAEEAGWKEEFIKERVTRIAREALTPVLSYVKEFPIPPQGSASPAELLLFALIAPLLLAGEDDFADSVQSPAKEALLSHTVVRLLAGIDESVAGGKGSDEYEPLRTWTAKMWEHLWSAEYTRAASSWRGVTLGSRQTSNETTKSPDERSSQAASSQSRTRAPTPARPQGLFGRLRSWAFPSGDATPTKDSKKDQEPLSELERNALRRLRIGRMVWAATAVMGTVGWIFLSGVVSIDFSDAAQVELELDQDEEDEEEELIDEEDEDGDDEEGLWLVDDDEGELEGDAEGYLMSGDVDDDGFEDDD
ncbi:unnamed protein product [Parajaminaea phylloscopi]